MERRRKGTGFWSDDRRRGDRRAGTGQVLQFRRDDDGRVDAGMFSAMLQRWSLTHRTTEPAAVAVAELEPLSEPLSEQTACPECGEQWDRLWLVRHLASEHPGWY